MKVKILNTILNTLEGVNKTELSNIQKVYQRKTKL